MIFAKVKDSVYVKNGSVWKSLTLEPNEEIIKMVEVGRSKKKIVAEYRIKNNTFSPYLKNKEFIS